MSLSRASSSIELPTLESTIQQKVKFQEGVDEPFWFIIWFNLQNCIACLCLFSHVTLFALSIAYVSVGAEGGVLVSISVTCQWRCSKQIFRMY